MKKQVNQLRSGVYLSYINLLLGSLIPMFYTPVMLKILGEAEHGLYSLVLAAQLFDTLPSTVRKKTKQQFNAPLVSSWYYTARLRHW